MTLILVDDSIATGCSILAAIAAIRRRSATRLDVHVSKLVHASAQVAAPVPHSLCQAHIHGR